jgi:phosphate/sulfate permease
MTFAGAALPLSRLDVLTRHPEFAGAVIVLVQIALVGCIYYPCAVMFTWVRRIPISEAQSFCAAGSVGIGALFGVWLEKTTGTINTPTIISILIAAPSLASLMLGVHILRRNKN